MALLAPRRPHSPNAPTETSELRVLRRDARGAVYVEFLIAFIPVFLLFLAVCQLIFLTAARLVVSHAAVVGARAAIVVLEDPANEYGGAPLGNLSSGKSAGSDWGGLLPLGTANAEALRHSLGSNDEARFTAQGGARMASIRMAASIPLMTLAPRTGALTGKGGSLNQSLVTSTAAQLTIAYGYTQAAAAITIQRDESSDEVATGSIDPKGPVTVAVTYLYQCSVPVIRGLMCRPLSLAALIPGGGYYALLRAKATLTNQGASYLTAETP